MREYKFKKIAFTLAEVLITLGIIGVVAAITIPILINSSQDQAFKTAYKAAYKDFSQAFAQSFADNSLTTTNNHTSTAAEWAIIKNAFNVSKDCTPAQLSDCWADGEKLFGGSPDPGLNSSSFIDASGRAWAEYYDWENLYLVDTNGFKPPNQYGKDRWYFTLCDANNNRASGIVPSKVCVDAIDATVKNTNICNYPPCYYKSWLFN